MREFLEAINEYINEYPVTIILLYTGLVIIQIIIESRRNYTDKDE